MIRPLSGAFFVERGSNMENAEMPVGMRDLFPADSRKKEALKKKIRKVFTDYGYQEIETPLIEFYSTYRDAFASIKEEEMYKFVDESGKILALRTDMTLPIARLCASKIVDMELPFRFSYCSDVYKVRQSFAGKRNEVTDCGVELIGLDASADCEVLGCALDVLEAIGLPSYTLEIGNSDFFRLACSEAGLGREDSMTLADLTDRKAMPELKEWLSGKISDPKIREFFAAVPLMNGRDALDEALRFSFSDSLRQEVKNLAGVLETLRQAGYPDHIAFDFGKLPYLDYYTGIIFEGYVDGVGTKILSGGRYDGLLKKFGRDLPACGFGVKLDYLLEVLPPEERKVRKLYYPRHKAAEALMKARMMRQTSPVEMIPWDKEETEVSE